MKATEHKQRIRRFWMISAVVVIVAEALMCGLMFWPQKREHESLRKQKKMVQQSLGEVKLAGAKFAEAATKIDRANDVVSELGFITESMGVDMIINAITHANKTLRVELLEITPLGDPANDSALCNACRLRCRGSFTRLVEFLHAVEKQGVLLESHGFAMEYGERNRMEMTVILKTLSTPALARGMKEESEDRKSERGTKRQRKRSRR